MDHNIKLPRTRTYLLLEYMVFQLVWSVEPLSWHFSPPIFAQGKVGTVINDYVRCEHLKIIELPAQRKTHQLIIEACVFTFVTKQRLDAYYRNDPKKYGLNVKLLKSWKWLFWASTLLVVSARFYGNKIHKKSHSSSSSLKFLI